jgi:proline iminopeptidase
MAEYYRHGTAYDSGMLDVGDGHQIYWEVYGNPKGKPAVVLHGGPGQGSHPGMARAFDPARYCVVLFDQRGCGRSRPHASRPDTNMDSNTALHLLADMEKLRIHFGFERWLISGGSWGSALGLAYAQRNPNRVSEMVLMSVTTAGRRENDWLYRGAAQFFPEEFERFSNHVSGSACTDLPAAYAKLLEHPDRDVRAEAAIAWCRWEDAVVSLEPNAVPHAYSNGAIDDLIAFVRICSHYAAHGAWLSEGELIENAGKLGGIPGVLIHGKLDLSCPLEIPWRLTRAWTGSELIVLADSGHLRSDSKRDQLIAALDRFAHGW